jgi:hypothetical protein
MTEDQRQTQGTIDDRDNKFHVDKSISVGHMVSTLALAGALAGFVFSTNTKVETVAIRVNNIEQRVERDAARQVQDMGLLRDQLSRMEDKLDRVIERESR